MRIFFAYPFTQLLNHQSGLIEKENIDFIMRVIKELKGMGHSVFSAQLREEFGAKLMNADSATYEDFNEMRSSDLVLAFPGQFPISGGVHVELGWASALGKRIILFLHKDQDYSPMVEGLHTVSNVKYISFGDESKEEFLLKIFDSIKEYLENVVNEISNVR